MFVELAITIRPRMHGPVAKRANKQEKLMTETSFERPYVQTVPKLTNQ